MAVLAGYAAVAIVFSWPLVLHLGTALTGGPGGDTGVYVWNQWVFRHELVDKGTDLIDEKYDEEFNAWYDTQHLPQLLGLPGVLDALEAEGTIERAARMYEVEPEDVRAAQRYQDFLLGVAT